MQVTIVVKELVVVPESHIIAEKTAPNEDVVGVKFFFPADAVQLGVASARVERTAQVLQEKEKQNEDDPTKQPEPEAGDQVHANEDAGADPGMPSQHPENENDGDGLGRASS